MLMRYHWGLGIGHQYAYTTVSTDPQFHSTSPNPHSQRHGIEDYRYHSDDEVNEDDLDLGDSTRTLEPDFEPSESGESQSDSESVLGDYVDMYGSGTAMEALTEYYGF